MQRSLISTKGRVTIPADLRKKFGIKPGTRIRWKKENGRLVLTPVGSERVGEKS
jgi:AbrB family looped-hinge helix DNA binding protein